MLPDIHVTFDWPLWHAAGAHLSAWIDSADAWASANPQMIKIPLLAMIGAFSRAWADRR